MLIFVSEHPRPGNIHGTTRQTRCALVGSGLAVQLVGEFMKDHIVTIVVVVGVTADLVPGKDHRSPVPGLPQTSLGAFGHHTARQSAGFRGKVMVRIDQDGA